MKLRWICGVLAALLVVVVVAIVLLSLPGYHADDDFRPSKNLDFSAYSGFKDANITLVNLSGPSDRVSSRQ